MSEFRRRLFVEKENQQNGFTKLLYLESYTDSSNSNGQYIDTNRKVLSTDVIKLDFEIIPNVNNAKSCFGWRYDGDNISGNNCYINTYPTYWQLGYGSNIAFFPRITLARCELIINPNTKNISVNGKIIYGPNNTDYSKPYFNGNSHYPVLLFTGNNKGVPWSGCNCRIYDYVVYDKDGNEVQHLVPVLDDNNRPCMYDTISGKFHYNQRTNRTDDFRYELKL